MTSPLEPSGPQAAPAGGRELPIVIDCEGSELIAVVHAPARPQSRGVLSIVAGGPQYRGGVCRLQVHLARDLAAAGVPVMRFDYRGLGDSQGEFRGFCDVGTDLAAAIRAFRAQVPELQEIVLWGGCDAASAAMINAWKFPEVTGMVLGNPWVHSEETGDLVAVKHYGQRIRDKDFWLKLLKLQYNPFPAALTLLRSAVKRLLARSAPAASAASAAAQDDLKAPFQSRMRLGLSRFKGDLLLLMSGRSLVSKEFDELVQAQAGWQQAMRSPRRVLRHDIAEADQAFSTIAARTEVNRVTVQWLLNPEATPR